VEVLDPGTLEATACACREILQAARSEIYGSGKKACDE
jgi:hypothetical protein